MDSAASYMAGSRHKDKCHWFVNGQALDAQSGQADKGQISDTETRLKTLVRCNKHKAMASEYLAEQQAEQETEHLTKQTQKTNDNALAA
jgi:hypothetical protein